MSSFSKWYYPVEARNYDVLLCWGRGRSLWCLHFLAPSISSLSSLSFLLIHLPASEGAPPFLLSHSFWDLSVRNSAFLFSLPAFFSNTPTHPPPIFLSSERLQLTGCIHDILLQQNFRLVFINIKYVLNKFDIYEGTRISSVCSKNIWNVLKFNYRSPTITSKSHVFQLHKMSLFYQSFEWIRPVR